MAALRQSLYAAEEELEAQKLKYGKTEEVIWSAIERNISGIKIAPVLPPGPADPGPSVDAVLHSTDWQVGKHIRGAYSSTIAQTRVEEYFSECQRRIQINPQAVEVAHMLYTGDLVEGELVFKGQAHKIDESLFRQVFRVAEMIVNGIRLMLATVPFVEAEGVGGNHGDNTRDSHPETNFDNMAMEVARRLLRDEPRLIFLEPITPDERHWSLKHDVRGKTWFGMHGNSIRSQPNTKATRDKLVNYHATIGPFDYVISGHYHQALQQDVGSFTHWAGGSTENGNTYALEFMASGAQVGSQWLHFQNDEEVVSSQLIRLR
jgi:predicted phosphodiesterase